MAKRFNYGVYIGRFQPLHIGHEAVIREALEKVDTLVIVIGSSDAAPNPHNPFTFEQREQMFRSVFRHEMSENRILLIPIRDYAIDDDWRGEVNYQVHKAILIHANPNPRFSPVGIRDLTIALAGYGKDASSYYLNLFPTWSSIQIETQHGTINASDIRHDYLRRLPRLPRDAVSEPVLITLRDFTLTERFKHLVEDVEAYKKGREEFGDGPFLTADVFIRHGDHILLVTRGKAPGRGLLALPGGFVERHERFEEAGYREAEEETGLTHDDLGEFYEGFYVEDYPWRSLRGRVVTGVTMFKIPEDQPRPQPVAGDDAAKAEWHLIESLKREDFFDDHFNIITTILET